MNIFNTPPNHESPNQHRFYLGSLLMILKSKKKFEEINDWSYSAANEAR